MKMYSKLGRLLEHSESNYTGCSSNSGTHGSYARCDFAIDATFEAGKAKLYLGVITENDAYKIIQVQIDSDVFIQ